MEVDFMQHKNNHSKALKKGYMNKETCYLDIFYIFTKLKPSVIPTDSLVLWTDPGHSMCKIFIC